MDTLYVYVDGSDLEDCDELLGAAFRELAERWAEKGCRFIDDRYARTPDLHPDDWSQWNLGINIPRHEFRAAEVAEIVRFAKQLADRSGREFLLGVDPETGRAEELMLLGSSAGESQVEWLVEHVAEP